ncbi:hypothetical protein VTK56DRAFT_8317 [Thermocarpiscus australiensis]
MRFPLFPNIQLLTESPSLRQGQQTHHYYYEHPSKPTRISTPLTVEDLDGPEEPGTSTPKVYFPAGNSDFRAVRNRCARACRDFNETPEDANPEKRSQKWLDIVRPDRDRSSNSTAAVTHDQTFANLDLKAQTPFVKPLVYIDYGMRLHVGGSTFINRGCMIIDTPVADVCIGEGCNIGPNCVIISVTYLVQLEERLLRHSIGQPVTIGNNVWIGANVTILGGVTIGDGAVIGACSLINRDVPPMTIAFGVPARVVGSVNDVKPGVLHGGGGGAAMAQTLQEALTLVNRLPMRRHCGDDPGGGGDDSEGEGEGLGRDGGVDLARGLYPVASGAQAEPRGLGRARERAVLLQRRLLLPPQGLRRSEVEAVAAVAAVVVAVLMAFFFAGVYLGANRASGYGG